MHNLSRKLSLALWLVVGVVFTAATYKTINISSVFAQGIPTACQQGTIDVKSHVLPDCDGGECPIVVGSSITLDRRFTASNPPPVLNQVVKVADSGGESIYQQKSSVNEQGEGGVHFLYSYNGSEILFRQDTIWDGFFCDGSGKDAMYRVKEVLPDGSVRDGGRYLNGTMSCGETVTNKSYIDTFENNPAINEPGNYNMDLNSCTVSGFSGKVVENTIELFFQGAALCNGTPMSSVIGVTNVSGAGAGEVLFYCKDQSGQGLGLCAWYKELSFSANNPARWDQNTDVCDLEAGKIPPYYVYPLNSLKTNDPNQISTELAQQGYEVACTIPDSEIFGKVKGKDEIVATLNNVFNVGSSESVDYSHGVYPLFRSSEPPTEVMSSLEAYFGYLDLETDSSEIGSETKSAPLYKLLPFEQQCELQKNMLAVINNMCNKLDSPADCALNNKIPGTDSSARGLYNRTIPLPCDAAGRKAKIAESEENRQLYEDLKRVPFYITKAYRLGFAVFAIGQEPDINTTGNVWDFLTDDNRNEGTAGHEVLVVAFKLPDTGTNKVPNPNSKVKENPDYAEYFNYPHDDIYYQDPLTITKNILTPKSLQDKSYEEYVQQRIDLINRSRSASVQGGRINCTGDYCDIPLAEALIKMINSGVYENSCKAQQTAVKKSETANTIVSKVELGASEIIKNDTENVNPLATMFKVGFQLISNLFVDENNQPIDPEQAQADFGSNMIPSGISGASQTKKAVEIYIVYPVGYELTEVENALIGAFRTKDQIDKLKEDPEIASYFLLDGVKTNFISDVTELGPFPDPDAPGCDPTTEEGQKKCFSTVEVSNDQQYNQDPNMPESDASKMSPRVQGGFLGYIIRDLQQSVRQFGTDAWYAIASCETTEDFLLGECGDIKKDINPVDALAQCEAKYVDVTDESVKKTAINNCLRKLGQSGDIVPYCVPVWIDKSTQQQYAAELKQTLADPATQDLWARYYAGYANTLNGSTATKEEAMAHQHLFLNHCNGGELCYDYILNRVVNETEVNPYFAIAVSLNETGGLLSFKDNYAGPHFGCGVDFSDPSGLSTTSQTIETKVDCFINTLNSYQAEGLSADGAMSKYGYKNGEHNQNINKIIGLLKDDYYSTNSCDSAPSATINVN